MTKMQMAAIFSSTAAGAISEVFFEIVQRDRNYDGYGAANAPFRVSAQKRVL